MKREMKGGVVAINALCMVTKMTRAAEQSTTDVTLSRRLGSARNIAE
jgi:hypothetical protein